MAEKLKVLFVGDVNGDPGKVMLREHLRNYIDKFEANLVVINGENTSGGKGITPEEADEMFALGANVITTGNHIWENWKSRPLLAENDLVLRPFNYPPGNPGRGFKILEIKGGAKVAVLQLQGRTFMQSIDCPFRGADHALKMIEPITNNIIVDFHADATGEKMAMGWHLDGRVSALIGTHTHIQTNDAQILPQGTAYITDAGMTGPYDSVLGMRKDVALRRYKLQTAHKYEMATDDAKFSGVFVEIDAGTGQALKIESFVEPPFTRSVVDAVSV